MHGKTAASVFNQIQQTRLFSIAYMENSSLGFIQAGHQW